MAPTDCLSGPTDAISARSDRRARPLRPDAAAMLALALIGDVGPALFEVNGASPCRVALLATNEPDFAADGDRAQCPHAGAGGGRDRSGPR